MRQFWQVIERIDRALALKRFGPVRDGALAVGGAATFLGLAVSIAVAAVWGGYAASVFLACWVPICVAAMIVVGAVACYRFPSAIVLIERSSVRGADDAELLWDGRRAHVAFAFPAQITLYATRPGALEVCLVVGGTVERQTGDFQRYARDVVRFRKPVDERGEGKRRIARPTGCVRPWRRLQRKRLYLRRH